ncbi:DUF4405 domain-containing protein [Pararhodospirillum oryzae]|uniref:Flavinylation-associated cytochrome domain-containing protein n=1 Tax=Pararhodospirillum oryzae TaxID=478448 RepID=A0A512H6I8_9PROT|nr:DUF4405 domain-containing protein [Pararhodospirillum oryzae]GEO81052.1 hypothetical protein ROR02_11830 [Pararhodospirillum oryzae]
MNTVAPETPSKFSFKRDLITPATTIVFLVVGVSGIMMFFHVGEPLVKSAHEWLGLAFAALAIWHVVRHARTFVNYLHRAHPRRVFAGVLAVCAVVLALTARPSGEGVSPRQVFRSLEQAPLGAVAQIAGTDEAGLRLALASRGIDASDATSLADIAQRSGADPHALLASVFQADRPSAQP